MFRLWYWVQMVWIHNRPPFSLDFGRWLRENQMDSSEFVQHLPRITQQGMVERGEVMAGIMLDPKHGVNPSLGCCFWCGEAIDVLLFGRLRSETKKAFGMRLIDTAAPREVVTSHEPCKACLEIMGRGICLMEATGPEDKAEPTGRYWVVTEACVRKIVKFDALADEIVTKGKSWISPGDAQRVGLYDVEPLEKA